MTTATAFTVKTINIGTSSPDLAPLAGREYTSSNWVSLPNANLPKAMRRELDLVFTALTGEELPLESHTLLVRAEDGVYSRLYGPALKAGVDGIEGTQTGKFFIQWGDRYIPVSLGKEGVSVDINGQTVSLEAEFGEFNFSGRGNDHALMIAVDEEDGTGQVVLPLAVRFTDWENPPEIKALNALMKKGKEADILSLVQEVTARGGGRQRADHDIDFRDLEEGVMYQVTGYRSVQTQYGPSYRITLADHPVEGETSECWAHASLRPLLATQPEISAEKPAMLTIKDKTVGATDGKVRIRCSLILSQQEEVSDDALDLNF